VIPQEALFSENQQPVTASVLIDPNGSMSQADVEAVVMIVSSSVEGLEANQVTVASTDGTVLHAAGDDTVTAVGNKQLRMTSDFESALSTDVANMLSSVLGAGRASVVVRAQLDFDERSTESETYTPESATPLRQQTIDENFDGAGTPPAGSLGTNGTPNPSTSDGAYTYTRKEDTTEYGIDKVVVRTTNAPGTIEKLSVAVVVDDGSLTGAAAPDVTALQALVGAAIGADSTRGDTVQVSAVPFAALDATATTDPTTTDSGGMMSMVPTILGALVLVGATLGLFLMSRGGKKGRARKGEVLETQDALPMGGEIYDAQVLAQAQAMQGLTDDVSALVERQPEEIATLLRSWLADRREVS
jgi:flagellar M-ring protein FliF